MTNDICKHQAYRIGSSIYGFQFHLEVTPEIISDWLAAKRDWLDSHYPSLARQIQAQIPIYAPKANPFAAQVAQAWLDLIPIT